MLGKRLLPLVMLGLVVAAGCPQGGGQRPISTPQAGQEAASSPADELKTQLKSLAETGAMFPGSETIGDNIASVKAADADKGAALEKDFAELNGAVGNPAQVKAIAQRMLEKL